ncbi:GntR family transcriptional regulator [Bordetella ansorpii]|uniref:GntR family transcriptional regulator n=1 Tax=Bordetella ansorpii TaxID=288768 RepID=A0A157S6G8_9BORD|nr:GntR family transcriptional regulator [Bordetella ansorpii]SAI65871.1 GntR family transcriptional regulator [Bordetella ansorpii]
MKKVTYPMVVKDLTAAIACGKHPVGSLLPTELELSALYGTSRHTIRAALQELQQLGLVSRTKNVGTRVEARERAEGFQQTLASLDGLVQFGKAHVREVQHVEEIVVDLELARTLGCPGGTRWLRISSLRLPAEDLEHPVGWTDVYVEPAYAEAVPIVQASPQTLLSNIIEERFGRRIAQIRQEVDAVSVPGHLAVPLNVEPGSPALQIVRTYLDASRRAFEISVTVHPAGRFTLSMLLNRNTE